MNERLLRIVMPLGFLLTCLVALAAAVYRPYYLNNYGYLQGVILIEVVVVTLWNYRRRFFPFLIIVFLWAGADVPLSAVWTSGRWFVLGLGAVAGFVIYLKDRGHSFGAWHMIAFVCLMSASVSSMVSFHPQIAWSKTLSLLLLFLYGATGARIALAGREAAFFSGLLLGCEIVVYVSAVCYFVAHLQIYGNPNSLGAIMGIAVAPILLWGVIIGGGTAAGRRRTFALALCCLLLLSSYSRSGIMAAAFATFLLCVALRRYRLLIKGAAVALTAAVLVAAVVPLPNNQSGQPGSFVSTFLFKGHESQGIMGSRQSPWDDTMRTVRQHPWFGTGFGTSAVAIDSERQGATYSSQAALSREHGNSYLAILESEGLLGVVPFIILIGMTIFNVGRVIKWMRQTNSPFSPAVPLAAIMAAGLVHATFEDWLFAVGSYLCVFYWSLAFMLCDTVRSPAFAPQHTVSSHRMPAWDGRYTAASVGR